MAAIELGGKRGGTALIDDDLLDRIPQLEGTSWHVHTLGYVRGRFEGDVCNLHRVIADRLLGCSPIKVVDHINGNKLDNRLCNLRVCFQGENARNTPMKKNNTSGIVGVYWDSTRCKWGAHIKVNRKYINLRWHPTLEAAAAARLAAEKKYFGEFAFSDPRFEPRAPHQEALTLALPPVDPLGL